MPNRKLVSAMITEAEDLMRMHDDDQIIQDMMNSAVTEMAHSGKGLQCWQEVVTGPTITAGKDSVTYTFDALLGIGVNVAALTMKTQTGDLRYTPEFVPWHVWDDRVQYLLDQTVTSNKPSLWTQEELLNPAGDVTLRVFPVTDVAYDVTLLIDYVPHVPSTSEYYNVHAVLEPCISIGAAYFAARALHEETATLWRREFEDAMGDMRRGFSSMSGMHGTVGGANLLVDTRGKAIPFTKRTGTAPAVAWDTNPAIPYDPANPDVGKEP